MRIIKTYSASAGKVFGAQPENYGDNLMTPLLRELFGVDPQYVSMPAAELIGIGSIIDCFHRRKGWNPLKRRPWRRLDVWGSGFMNEKGKAFWPQNLQFHAVRGSLSRSKIGMPNLPLGDPAILLPKIWPKRATLTSAVVIIPHFVTYADFVSKHASSLPRHWQIINLLSDPRTVTEQIATSELVISSSLHGLILADAYAVPSIWMRGDSRIKGDGFKFRDYESFRQLPLAGPVSFPEIMRDEIKPSPAAPPSEATVSSLLRAMPFA